MDATGRSDAGTHIARWLREAGFVSVDPGKRPLAYSGADLPHQTSYVGELLESFLPTLVEQPGESTPQLEAGLAGLRALPGTPGAGLGWTAHKATAVRRRAT